MKIILQWVITTVRTFDHITLCTAQNTEKVGEGEALFYGIIVEQSDPEVQILVHVSWLVHGLHGVWCLFQGWDSGTLGNTLSQCLTQDPRVGPSEGCGIHPTHTVNMLGCVHEWGLVLSMKVCTQWRVEEPVIIPITSDVKWCNIG